MMNKIVTDPETQQRSILEQHLGTILQVMVVGLLGWSLNTTISLSKDVEVLKVQMTSMAVTLTRDGGQFTRSDAQQECQVLRDADARMERRIERLEEAFRK